MVCTGSPLGWGDGTYPSRTRHPTPPLHRCLAGRFSSLDRVSGALSSLQLTSRTIIIGGKTVPECSSMFLMALRSQRAQPERSMNAPCGRYIFRLAQAACSNISPRCVRAQIAACVRFCSLSFRRIAFICTFTVNSVITILRAIILFDAPSVNVRKITNSRRDRLLTTSSPGCSPACKPLAGDRVSGRRGKSPTVCLRRSIAFAKRRRRPRRRDEAHLPKVRMHHRFAERD